MARPGEDDHDDEKVFPFFVVLCFRTLLCFFVFSVLCCVHVSGVAVFQAPWLIWIRVLIDLGGF